MNYFFLVLSFLLVAFGQPASQPVLGIVSAFVGYALFWKGMWIFDKGKKRFLLSLLWFACVQAVQLSWMVSFQYMGPMILLVYLFLIISLGVQFGLLSLLIPKRPLFFSEILGISGTWVLLEWVRLFFMTGFTWNPVGLALTSTSFSMGWASIGGIYFLSFWVILVNLLGYSALFFYPSRKRTTLWLGLGLLPFVFGFSQQMLVSKNAPMFSAVLVQTSLSPEERDGRISPDHFISHWNQWRRILKYLPYEKDFDLLVLPESALPHGAYRMVYSFENFTHLWQEKFGEASLDYLPSLKKPLAEKRGNSWYVCNAYWGQSLANLLQTEIIIGLDDQDEISQNYYNAAFHFLPESDTPPDRYEKRILVPMGEYIPWEWTKDIAAKFGIFASFTPGEEAKVFSGKIPIGISICIEEIYSSLMRENRIKGAKLFVNITNDVWFPGVRLPKQHFYHGAVRAVENGIPIVRATNTGITGAVDAFGRKREFLSSPDTAGSVYVEMPLVTYSTLYSFWGDSFILLSSMFFVLLLVRKKASFI